MWVCVCECASLRWFVPTNRKKEKSRLNGNFVPFYSFFCCFGVGKDITFWRDAAVQSLRFRFCPFSIVWRLRTGLKYDYFRSFLMVAGATTKKTWQIDNRPRAGACLRLFTFRVRSGDTIARCFGGLMNRFLFTNICFRKIGLKFLNNEMNLLKLNPIHK